MFLVDFRYQVAICIMKFSWFQLIDIISSSDVYCNQIQLISVLTYLNDVSDLQIPKEWAFDLNSNPSETLTSNS